MDKAQSLASLSLPVEEFLFDLVTRLIDEKDSKILEEDRASRIKTQFYSEIVFLQFLMATDRGRRFQPLFYLSLPRGIR